MRRRTLRIAAATLPVIVAAVAGCDGGNDAVPPDTSPAASTSPTRAVSMSLDPRECAKTPPTGRIDRTASDLSFTQGTMMVAVAESPSAPSQCFAFAKAGNAAPEVPPDSVLFTFGGPGTDGAQVDIMVSNLTGGILPPNDGAPMPSVGPLTAPVPAQVGVSVQGRYRLAPECRLTVTSLNATRTAGRFECPVAAQSSANPFDPSDVPTDTDASVPTTTQAPAPARLSGWFDLTP